MAQATAPRTRLRGTSAERRPSAQPTFVRDDISGKWTFNVETAAGSGTPTFVFKQAGEKLTGTYNGTFGSAELTGTVKGSDVEFTFEANVGDQKGKVVYKGKVDAPGKMKGSV